MCPWFWKLGTSCKVTERNFHYVLPGCQQTEDTVLNYADVILSLNRTETDAYMCHSSLTRLENNNHHNNKTTTTTITATTIQLQIKT